MQRITLDQCKISYQVTMEKISSLYFLYQSNSSPSSPSFKGSIVDGNKNSKYFEKRIPNNKGKINLVKLKSNIFYIDLQKDTSQRMSKK